MQLHQLRQTTSRHYPKVRVGRGGKRGTTSGRGTKGQGSRSGHRIRPAERDLIQRLPKLRGSRSRRLPRELTATVTLGDIVRSVSGSSVTMDILRKARLMSRSATRAKVVAGGKVDRALAFEGVAVSKTAKEAIVAAGGTVK